MPAPAIGCSSPREIELAEDFDGFAYREFLARQGIAAIARADSAEVDGRGERTDGACSQACARCCSAA